MNFFEGPEIFTFLFGRQLLFSVQFISSFMASFPGCCWALCSDIYIIGQGPCSFQCSLTSSTMRLV